QACLTRARGVVTLVRPSDFDLTPRFHALKGIRMKRRTLGAAGLLWLALTAAAAAQGPDDALLLRYHFQPGQEFHYRVTMTGDLATTMGGANLPPGAVPPKIPMNLTSNWEMVQKVKAVSPEGAATVSIGFEKLETNMAF